MENITLEFANVTGDSPGSSPTTTAAATNRGMVRGFRRRTKKGKVVVVKPHKRKVKPGALKPTLHPGMTQTAEHIRKNGLRWGGRTFNDAHQFGAWLRARGSSLHAFQAHHGTKIASAVPKFGNAIAHEKTKIKAGTVKPHQTHPRSLRKTLRKTRKTLRKTGKSVANVF